MKRLLFVIGVFFFPLFGHAQDWQTFDFPEGGFSIRCPHPLAESVDTIEVDIGTIFYHTLQYKPEKGKNAMYSVNYFEYPNAWIHSDSTELVNELLQATADEEAELLRGELMYFSETKLEGYPGRFWRIDFYDGTGVVKTKALMIENRFFLIKVYTPTEYVLNEEASWFYDSFKLLD